MNTGRVFDISRGCVDDGPGYRTVVFLKGCALGCPWCHNPEGKSFDVEIACDASRCIGCQACLKQCPRTWPKKTGAAWRTNCIACGRCVAVCPTGARRLAGRTFAVDELVATVVEDADFFRGTGGGVTFSGGEPLAQAEFLFACAERLRRQGVHVALETSGFWPVELANTVAEAFDLILLDLKHANSEKFFQATGQDNCAILKNLETMLALAPAVEIRLTLIPGFNDSVADLAAIAKFLRSLPGQTRVTLLPFHRLAASKERTFNCKYEYADTQPMDRSQLAAITEILGEQGISAR
jgi:pyruvate formate lyase activating enzyme